MELVSVPEFETTTFGAKLCHHFTKLGCYLLCMIRDTDLNQEQNVDFLFEKQLLHYLFPLQVTETQFK